MDTQPKPSPVLSSPSAAPQEQSEDNAVVTAITAIVREADRTFERVGGSSRHWVRDCFLPLLNKHGWTCIQAAAPSGEAQKELLADAWYAGRRSVMTLPLSESTGPKLQALCDKHLTALAASQGVSAHADRG